MRIAVALAMLVLGVSQQAFACEYGLTPSST